MNIAKELTDIVRELVEAKTAAKGLVPDEWMDALESGAKRFLKEAKMRGFIVKRPYKFVGGIRMDLGSAGGKDGVEVLISLFKPVNKPWFIDIKGWVDGDVYSIRKDIGDKLPSPNDVATAIKIVGRRSFWRR